MAKSTEVAAPVSAEVDLPLSPEEEALIAQNQAEANPDEFQIPILKLAQAMTNEVSDGIASPGEFVLGLTGESFAPPIEFIVAGKGKGRFKPGDKRKGTRTLVANDTLICPWKDDPFYGVPFTEHPDAEEAFRAAVNDGQREWGSGPPIQSTANYTGYIVGSQVPMRFSIKLTNKPARQAASKWDTLLDAVLRGKFWDQVFELGSTQEQNANGDKFYVPTVKMLRPTTAEERQAAIQLATILRNRTVTEVGGDDAPVAKPADNGGLSV